MSAAIDAVIPIGPNDVATAHITARSIHRFVEGVRNVYVVCRENPGIDGTTFISEAAFPFDLHAVRTALGVDKRAGWYLQQLIKLYFPLVVTDCIDRVLAVDADTIFLRRVRFVDDGRVVFNFGDEFHRPYFEHMQRMHPSLTKLIVYSGITHCMLFDRSWLAELMALIETHHGPAKASFWKIFLTSVDPKHREHSGASEYETYFNFCIGRHPKELVIRRFHWRNITTVDDVRPDLYDYVSLHWHARAENIDYGQLAVRALPAL